MRNLKRALSLVLAAMMLIGMMVVGASAASVDKFTDSDDIVNKDAVSTMVALNIINGKEDGSYFDPTGDITRGEMAKMICVMLNGGVDPALGVKDVPSFSDIDNHWAEKYIEYCTTLGIIAGRGDGTFDPDATVTSTEVAKMVLVTLGYDPTTSGLVGNDWSTKTNTLANQKGLYKKLTSLSVSAPMSRDNAAQMLYNGLNAEIVTLTNGEYVTRQVITDSVTKVENGYHMEYTVGGVTYLSYNDAYVANGNSSTGITSSKVTDYTYVASTTTTTETLGRRYLDLKTYSGVVTATGYVQNKGYTATLDNALTFTEMSEDALSYVGQKVKVLYTDTDSVYGVYSHDDTTISVAGVVGDLNTTELNDADDVLTFDGVNYRTDLANAANVPVVNANGSTSGVTTLSALRASTTIAMGSTLKLYDNNGNGKIDIAVVTPVEVYKVNFVSATEVTLVATENTDATINAQANAYKLEDVTAYDGMAKGDYVAYYDNATCSSDTKDVLVKLERQTGAITGTRTGEIQIDGTWYSSADLGSYTAVVGNHLNFVAVGDYIFSAETTAASFDGKYLVIKGFQMSFSDVTAQVLLSDGTSAVVTLEKVSDTGAVNDYHKLVVSGLNYYFDKNDNGSYDSGTDVQVTTDTLYAYTVNSDNTYRLTAVNGTTATKNILGVDGYGTAALANKMFGATNISNDTIVFVKDDDGYRVTTGANVKSWGNTVANVNGTPAFVYTNSNGYPYANVAFIAFNAGYEAPTASDGSIYGYVTGSPYNAKVGDKNGTMYSVWNGTETVEFFAAAGDITGSPVKGDIIKYVITSTGSVNVGKVQATYSINTAVAIDGYDAASGRITFKSQNGVVVGDAAYEVTNDTKYLAINSADKVGVPGADKNIITLANKDSAGNLIGDVNALFVVASVDSNGNSIKDLALVVVDTANKISGLGSYKMNSASAIKGASNGITITVTPNVNFASNTDTVTYTVKVTGTAAAGDASDTIQITGIGNLTDTNSPNSTVSTDTITITASGALNETFTATVATPGTDVTPAIVYTAA